jgi:hypothetical protein
MSTPNKEYFVDVFQDMIDHIVEIYDPIIGVDPNQTGGEKPYALYGSLKAIVQELIERDDKKLNNYPLIALILDLEENAGTTLSNEYIISPRIIILEQTKKEFYPSERITNSFKTVLYPLYNLLLDEISLNPCLNTPHRDLIEHKKTDRLDWGTQQANDKLNEFLDGIDLRFTNLRVFKQLTENCILQANV